MKKGLTRYVLTDEIYIILKEQILSHQIAPGEKINIDQLARDLEVSNIPIREALSRLTTENLVTIVPFKGMYATNMSLQELDEIFEIRMQLEGLAIRKAAEGIPDQLLIDLEAKMRRWSALNVIELKEKISLIAEMNQSLHGLILEYCGNQSLKSLIQSYIERIQRYLLAFEREMTLQVIEEEWNEHMEVICCLSSRRVVEAEEALLKHLNNSLARTRKYFV